MYAVIFTTGFAKDINSADIKLHKVYKKKETAFRIAFTRNQGIKNQVLGRKHYVYDQLKKEIFEVSL